MPDSHDQDDRPAPRDQQQEEGPGRSPDLKELIRFLAVDISSTIPTRCTSRSSRKRAANVYELEVAEADLGKVIGRGGKTARALRTVVQTVAPQSRKRTLLEILE